MSRSQETSPPTTSSYAFTHIHEAPLSSHPFSHSASSSSSQQPTQSSREYDPPRRPPTGGLPPLPPSAAGYPNQGSVSFQHQADTNGPPRERERQRGESSPATSRHLPPSIAHNEAFFPREQSGGNGVERTKSSSTGPREEGRSKRDETREERRARKERERAARGVVDALDGAGELFFQLVIRYCYSKQTNRAFL